MDKKWIVLVAAAALPLAAWTPAMAPEYTGSRPARGQELHRAPEEVTISFSEPLDPSSTMTVTDRCGRRVDDGEVTVQLNEMSVGIARRPSGRYKVDWTAVGIAGVTGTNEGAFSFLVHLGPACGGGRAHHGGHGSGHGEGDSSRHGGNHTRGHQSGPTGSGAGHAQGHQTGHGGHQMPASARHGAHSGPLATRHRGHRSVGPAKRHSGPHGQHEAGRPGIQEGGDEGTMDVAAGSGPLQAPADLRAAALALGLSALMGLAGGAVLRLSGRS